MVHPTSVTNTIDRLEKQGHVVRRPNPEDGRGTLAEITATGREVVAAATADLMAAEFGMGGYSDDQLEEISPCCAACASRRATSPPTAPPGHSAPR